ncbi:hypothetical protein M408DRAFT_86280 [Serendipita vermifera MAFF 305830]|uniref:Uncharacterized protein n=1 Tax=Serendipita vermifera MAFF 305830 TaxID=933852 RepID=A0A0C2XYA1_SERVB|nr:hypothetical protein M408DRAFT_86280 [Serendipita vermifera MAFF 305830]
MHATEAFGHNTRHRGASQGCLQTSRHCLGPLRVRSFHCNRPKRIFCRSSAIFGEVSQSLLVLKALKLKRLYVILKAL